MLTLETQRKVACIDRRHIAVACGEGHSILVVNTTPQTVLSPPLMLSQGCSVACASLSACAQPLPVKWSELQNGCKGGEDGCAALLRAAMSLTSQPADAVPPAGSAPRLQVTLVHGSRYNLPHDRPLLCGLTCARSCRACSPYASTAHVCTAAHAPLRRNCARACRTSLLLSPTPVPYPPLS